MIFLKCQNKRFYGILKKDAFTVIIKRLQTSSLKMSKRYKHLSCIQRVVM